MNTDPGPLTKEIAGLITGRMARYGVKQGEVAPAIAVTQSQLSKMLRGLRPINIDQLEIMCHMLGIEVDAVVDEAVESVNERGLWPAVDALVLDGERVSRPIQDEPTRISDEQEKDLRKPDVALAARRGKKKSDQ